MNKIAVYFLKNQERTPVLAYAFGLVFIGAFLLIGNVLNQVFPESSNILSNEIKKGAIITVSFGMSLSLGAMVVLKISRVFDKVHSKFIIR